MMINRAIPDPRSNTRPYNSANVTPVARGELGRLPARPSLPRLGEAAVRIIVLGGDGYLGWPTAMHFAARGHEVWTVDNYLRRQLALQTCSEALIPSPQPWSSHARELLEFSGPAVRSRW